MEVNKVSNLTEELFKLDEDNENQISVCQNIANEIENGNEKIHKFVERLGPYLTSTDVGVRCRGVKTLSMVLNFLPENFLNETEVELLTSFYCDRLNDHHTIVPSTIQGILSIIRMTNLPGNATSRLFNCIFRNVRCQSELQEIRKNIYSIFRIALKTRIEDLKSMGPDFVYGLISSMDGECEPRNLMLLFDFLPFFIKEFSLGHLTEEMFEVIACYFPIDFNTSISGEKKKITREDLAEALAPCLYAIPEFGEFCLPHILEKLDSDRKIAKIDSLSILCKGASTFGSEVLKNHLNELWPIMKKEIINGTDNDVKNAALTAFTAVIEALSKDKIILKEFVEKILSDLRWSLCDVQLSLYWPSERLLEAVAKASKDSCTQILIELVPLCLGQYSTKTSITDKISTMETLNNFIKITTDFGFNISDIPELSWTDIPGLYLNELKTEDNTLKTKTLSGLTIQKSFLKDGQRLTIYERIADMIEADSAKELKNICQTTFLSFANVYPNEILDLLNKRLQIDVDNISTTILSRRLEAASILVRIPEIGIVILPKIVEIATSNNPEIRTMALSSLKKFLLIPNHNFNVHNYLYNDCKFIDRLMNSETSKDPKNFSIIAKVCRLIVRKLNIEYQQTIIDKYINNQKEKTSLNEREVILFEGILTPLRQNVLIDKKENFLLELLNLSIKSTDYEVRQSSCKIVAVLVNKMMENVNFERITKDLREKITNTLESDDFDVETKKAAINLHSWLTKSLVTKGSLNSQDFLDYQINILRLDTIGSFAADEFKTLVDKNDETLVEDNFCTVKLFHKQRILQSVIISGCQFETESRKNYLIALAHLVEEVPIELIFMQLEEIVPLLIESLSLDDGQLILSTLKTLKPLLETKHDIFLDQIQSFIPRCLQLSTYKKMSVRIAALDCLLSYCNYPIVELLKHRQDVLDKLAEPLDDHKRLVRQIAVKARTRWYLVGAPGGPD